MPSTTSPAPATSQVPTPLSPSELGTKQYWETYYSRDLTTHALNPTHKGEGWFASSGASPKILSYLLSHAAERGYEPRTASILDLGCGNGELLMELREGGFEGRLVGVDYSEVGVGFARKIVGGLGIRVEVWDVLTQEPGGFAVRRGEEEEEEEGEEGSWFPEGGFEIVLDKGTFDAVSLSEELDAHGRRVGEGYAARVEKLMRRDGVFLVTSCNWTETELEAWFAALEPCGRILYPRFRFGGGEGQAVSSVCFRRRGAGDGDGE